jgi:hypothetical protein
MPNSKTKTTEAPLTDEQKVAKTYSMANAKLREAHLPEWNRLRQEAATALGVTWEPQPTKEQKAAAEIEKLIAANPGLANVFVRQEPEADPDVEEPSAPEAPNPEA